MAVSNGIRAHRASRSDQSGFTLLEMALVLVVIGVVLGSVMIGRDVQRNAEYNRIRQTFVNQWAVAYNSYWQRYGGPVGDSRVQPRLMVNGENFAGNGIALSGGNMSGVTPPPAVCEGNAGPNMARSMQGGVSLREMMLQAGIELPQGRGVGREDRYAYLDTNGNPQEIQVCFQWNPPGTRSGTGNVMVLSGLTPDLARALSNAIKGNSDASSGSFRQEGVVSGASTFIDWVGDNTRNIGANGGSDGGGDRELQVATVVAHFKMNQ